MLTKEELKNNIREWCFSVRNYNSYSVYIMNVEKTFNGGRGSIELFHFDFEAKTIVVNVSVYTRADAYKLREFIKSNHLENWKVIGGKYDPWPCPHRVWSLNVKDALKQNLKLKYKI